MKTTMKMTPPPQLLKLMVFVLKGLCFLTLTVLVVVSVC